MEKLQSFHRTRKGYMIFGLTELLLAYVFASIAIDTANMFAYFFMIIMTIGALYNLTNAVKSHNKKAKAKR